MLAAESEDPGGLRRDAVSAGEVLPSPRHVLMTADAVGGVWAYAVDLSGALAARGVHVTCAVLGPPPDAAQREAIAALPNVRLAVRPCKLEWMDDPWEDVEAAGAWLLALEREALPDVVHLNGYAHASLPWRAPVLVTGHSCVLSWWDAVHGASPPRAWARYASVVSKGLRRADLVAAPTAAMLSALERHYGPLRRACVIPNGRRAAPQIDTPKEPFVLTAGRLWDEGKNVGAVCAAAASIPWPVYAAGDWTGPGGTRVHPVPPGVTPLGRLPFGQLATWMARAAIFALPARYEPFGLTAVEAAVAGCALVLGDIRSLREVWGDAAVYVPSDNRRALAAALNRLIADPDRRREMSDRARTRARDLTPDRMAERYLAAYGTLPRTRHASRARTPFARHGSGGRSAGAGRESGAPAGVPALSLVYRP